MSVSPATRPEGSGPAACTVDEVTAWPACSPGPGPVSDRESWARVNRQARCADSSLGADQWFPVSADAQSARREAAAAIAICQACPVRSQCLALSLRHWDVGQHGIWGGLVTADRTRLRQRMLAHRAGALRYFTDAVGLEVQSRQPATGQPPPLALRAHSGMDGRPGPAARPADMPVHQSSGRVPDGTAQAQRQELRHPPDVVILGFVLHDLDRAEVLRELRSWAQAPIIVLSGRASNTGMAEPALASSGAGRTPPIWRREPPAEAPPASRRADGDGDAPQVRIGDMVVDLAAKRVIRQRRDAHAAGTAADIRLTPTEWRLLEVLLRSPGRLLSQQQLLAKAWGPGYARATGNLRLYMAQLRRKLEPDPTRPRWLLTEPGLGYRFQPDPQYQ